ncbi:hypothetical protein C8J57DRAFT_1231724 [Mycena rebaudengoi]|nr:hypothetical protein C8J57DRAFT_1231724 [Mycena rebaudengoi]
MAKRIGTEDVIHSLGAPHMHDWYDTVHFMCSESSRPWGTAHAAFVPLKSIDNIPIESSWNLYTNYVGLDTKKIILLGKTLNYFNPGLQLYIDLFNWLWPKIVQLSLDDFVEYWNNHKIQTQYALRENILKSQEECYR